MSPFVDKPTTAMLLDSYDDMIVVKRKRYVSMSPKMLNLIMDQFIGESTQGEESVDVRRIGEWDHVDKIWQEHCLTFVVSL